MIADEVGASISASIRFYVENHPEPMALLQTGRRPSSTGAVPVFLHTASPTWTAEFPPPITQFGQQVDLTTGRLGELAAKTDAYGGVSQIEARLRNRDGEFTSVELEAFDNHHTLFFLIRRARRLELGRRARAVATPA